MDRTSYHKRDRTTQYGWLKMDTCLLCYEMMAWNSFLDNLRDPFHCSSSSNVVEKLYFVQDISGLNTTEMLHDIALYKFNTDTEVSYTAFD